MSSKVLERAASLLSIIQLQCALHPFGFGCHQSIGARIGRLDVYEGRQCLSGFSDRVIKGGKVDGLADISPAGRLRTLAGL